MPKTDEKYFDYQLLSNQELHNYVEIFLDKNRIPNFFLIFKIHMALQVPP